MKRIFLSAFLLVSLSLSAQNIDRKQVVERNNPHVVTMDSLNSLSVGNGGFAMTVDGTGLQSFPKSYSKGVPLGTMSDWGWHSFANPENYKPEEKSNQTSFKEKDNKFRRDNKPKKKGEDIVSKFFKDDTIGSEAKERMHQKQKRKGKFNK